MGLFGFGKKKEDVRDNSVQIAAGMPLAGNAPANFTFGVCDTFHLKGSNDLVVVGNLKGTLRVKDAIYVSNPGDDNTPPARSIVVAMEKPDASGRITPQQTATDEHVSVRVENGAKLTFKPGTVLHSWETSAGDVHSAYVNAIGAYYVSNKQCILSEEDVCRMSIADIAETWRLLNLALTRVPNLTQEIIAENYAKLGVMAKALVQKLYASDHIYVVYDKNTGRPKPYIQAVKRGDVEECLPPDLMVVTEAYQAVYAEGYKGSQLELRRVENGADKKGIRKFLEECFAADGIKGVDFLYQEAAVDHKLFLK